MTERRGYPVRVAGEWALQAAAVRRRIAADDAQHHANGVIGLSGTLYVVATPIGNLGDLTERARQTLSAVALVAAEDTRHSGQLLAQLGLSRPLWALHEHNEAGRAGALIARLQAGDDVALVSDAGTPLISDPGFRVVAEAAAAGIRVVPVPGPCAAIAGLSIAGLPTDRFVFEGFLPAKTTARRTRLGELKDDPRTLVLYESPHRLDDTLADLAAIFGADRQCVIAREISKMHETVYRSTVAELATQARTDSDMRRGETVIMVAGQPAPPPADPARFDDALRPLLAHAPLSLVVDVIAELTGERRKSLYERALQLKAELHST